MLLLLLLDHFMSFIFSSHIKGFVRFLYSTSSTQDSTLTTMWLLWLSLSSCSSHVPSRGQAPLILAHLVMYKPVV